MATYHMLTYIIYSLAEQPHFPKNVSEKNGISLHFTNLFKYLT